MNTYRGIIAFIVVFIVTFIALVIANYQTREAVQAPTASSSPVSFNIPLPVNAFLGTVQPNSLLTNTSVVVYK